MKKVTDSMEDYLEAILVLSKRLPVVRSVDIADFLNFKKPSVSVAVKKLKEQDKITVTKEGYIYLTESGREIASTILERHMLFTNWLVFMGVDEETAARDACRLEHAISDESFAAMKKHLATKHNVK